MEWIQAAALLIGGSGLIGGGAAIYQARKSAVVGMSGNEVEARKAVSADWEAWSTQVTGELSELREALKNEKKERTASTEYYRRMRAEDLQYISDLQRHIWMGYQPPPPDRKPFSGVLPPE